MSARLLIPLPLILYTFSVYMFGLLLYLQMRQYRLRRPDWGGWAWRGLAAVFAVVYVCYLAGHVSVIAMDGLAGEMPQAFRVALRAAMPFVAPLVVQVFYAVERQRLSVRGLWRGLIAIEYGVAGAAAALGALLETDRLPAWADAPGEHVQTITDASLAAAGLAAAGIVWASRRTEQSASNQRQNRWRLMLVCALEAGFGLQAVWDVPWLGIGLRLLPVVFVLVTVYYGERLAFWDVFAKRGAFFFLALLALTGHFALLGPRLDLTILDFARSWTIALSIVPLVAVAPWAYARLDAWVDRAWLGRRYSPIEALRRFSESVGAAVDEDDLLGRAEASLQDIFSSPAHIVRCGAAGGSDELRAALRVGGGDWGEIRVQSRAEGVPFLSQDAELLVLLARSLGAAIESESLRGERLAQQEREQILALSAAQSELKALRAQINPHFLFNALNTIASLIPRAPALAEQTVEQLSEVFRYTVRNAEREWVRLEDEMAAVEAYLDIEQARFGERLRVEVRVATEARGQRIPAMVVQTLVENAVKHGISAVRGPGIITISARVADGKLRVAVEDSGPGFSSEIRPESLPRPGRAGYGLRNVRERLRAHYGPAANLAFSRTAAGLTEVAFEIPVAENGVPECVS